MDRSTVETSSSTEEDRVTEQDKAEKQVEQIRRMLANPRRTRR